MEDIRCKKCEEGPETFWHLWCSCPALHNLRRVKDSRFQANNMSDSKEYGRGDLFSDIIWYYNSPQVQEIIEDNSEAMALEHYPAEAPYTAKE